MQTPIHERITTIKTGNANAYLIGTEKGFILIDTGTPNSFSRFQEAFTAQDISFSDLIVVVLTHTHYDHAGCAAEIQTRTSAPVIVHKKETEFVKQGFTPLPHGTKPFGKMMIKLAGASKSARDGYQAFSPDVSLSEKYDLAQYGINGFIVPTPGHTDGSLSVIIEDDACFTGDSVFNFPFSSFYPPFANDTKTLLQTWKYFTSLPCSVFYPGHGKPVPRNKFFKAVEKITQ